MTIKEALVEGGRVLALPCPSAFIDTPELDASLLLSETLHKSREELIILGDEPVAEPLLRDYFALLDRRRSGECIAYILGRKEFCGLQFAVSPSVLVPRPDTEILFEAALDNIDNMTGQMENKNISVLDLCTGSGALAISLKNERPQIDITASDISVEALETAKLNAASLLDHEHGINFIQSGLFEKITGKFNIIVSNPPYIPSRDMGALSPEVRREPALALDGGRDGLDLIRQIITQAGNYLHCKGVLLLEAAPGQMPEIRALLEQHDFGGIRIRKDLAGRDRVICSRSQFGVRLAKEKY